MDLSHILQTSNCRVNQRFADKAACLGELARRAAATLRVPPASVLAALNHREALGSTGLGNGIALPHAKLAGITTPYLAVTRLREAIGFDAVDDRPVDVVCVLLTSPTEPGGQLNVLACIARRLRDPIVLGSIRSAKDAMALHAALTDAQVSSDPK